MHVHSRLKKSNLRDTTNNRFDGQLEQRQGEISCAECHRLKTEWDEGMIPCHACQKRGCASLFPDSSLATGHGLLFVFAATRHLHDQLAKISARGGPPSNAVD